MIWAILLFACILNDKYSFELTAVINIIFLNSYHIFHSCSRGKNSDTTFQRGTPPIFLFSLPLFASFISKTSMDLFVYNKNTECIFRIRQRLLQVPVISAVSNIERKVTQNLSYPMDIYRIPSMEETVIRKPTAATVLFTKSYLEIARSQFMIKY